MTFEKDLTRPPGRPRADLLAPGHPLLDAVTDLIIERYGTLLKQGTVLVDRHDPAETPRLLVAVTQEITDGHDPARTISKRFDYVEIGPGRSDGAQGRTGCAPPARRGIWTTSLPMIPNGTVALRLRDDPWLSSGVESLALDWAVTRACPPNLPRTRDL